MNSVFQEAETVLVSGSQILYKLWAVAYLNAYFLDSIIPPSSHYA